MIKVYTLVAFRIIISCSRFTCYSIDRLMACIITPPCDAVRRPLQNFTYTFTFAFMHLVDTFIQSDLQCIQAIHVLSVCTYKHIVRLRDDAIFSFACFILHFMKASSAVNYLYVHTVVLKLFHLPSNG